MKISILTPTYNREKLLPNLYNSLIQNIKDEIEIEWIITDDGSTDQTENLVNTWQQEGKFEIKYFKQENQGKMASINNMVEKATGDLIVECDSDDYFTNDAFLEIYNIWQEHKDKKNLYGLCFLKYDSNGNNMGNNFKKKETTMFDLYFKEGETGEKSIVFFANVRKQYKYELEKNERFVTEARMYHKMDEKYKILCINKPIMICEYQKDGYTKNIKKQFIENPYGYYEYFKEILQKDFRRVAWNKRLYAIKHYILFSYLTKNKKSIQNIKGIENKVLYLILYLPGIIKSKKFK